MLNSIPARFPIGTVLLLIWVSAEADIPANLPIDRVTVYQEGAVVTRTGTVTIPAGVNRLLIQGLPAALETKTLHVSVESQGARLGAIEVERINEGQYASEGERELRRQIEQTADQRAALQDEIATAQLQLKLLDSLAANPSGGSSKGSVDGANLGAVLTSMSANSAAARKRVRDSTIRMRGLDHELEKQNADLAKIETHSQLSTVLRTTVEANVASSATVTVSYAVHNAGWHWIYEARLDTNKKHIDLDRQGQVQQGSGEDWKNVELTLSTALPSGDVTTPDVGSLFVNLQDYPPRGPFGEPQQINARAMSAAAPAAALQEVTMTAKRKSASVVATEYLADYRVPDRVTLLADREPRLYAIADDVFDVDLLARIVPSAGRTAYLQATFKYQREQPLEGGQLQLYRDGAYVGEATTPAFLPGAQVHMPFGADERIHVEIHDESAQSAERGVFSKQMVKETRSRFDITSFHPSPIIVEVVDRIPVSQQADVRIEFIKGATEPTTKDAEGKPGVLLWHFDAQPQKTVSIHHEYSIEYPKDRQLTEREDDPTG
jgi:uncharacterized protein (TIGR02231 family)